MIVGISGFAGSGKDAVAGFLRAKHHFLVVALADPLKRICRDVYDFTDEQLWGPSQMRNAADPRFVKSRQPQHTFITKGTETHLFCTHCQEEFRREDEERMRETPCVVYLSPRYALQRLGTEWGRDCYPNTWVDLAIRTARELLGPNRGDFGYTANRGVFYVGADNRQSMVRGVAIPDVRFRNEFEAIRAAGGRLVRVVRPGAGLKGSYAAHASESEQTSIQDDEFDHVIQNTGTLDDLAKSVDAMIQTLERGRFADR